MQSYENDMPHVEEFVVAKVVRISEIGVVVNLLEYENKEAIVLSSEISRKRVTSVPKLMRPNSIQTLIVLRTDVQKKCIDCSKRLVTSDDNVLAQEKWNQNKQIYLIVNRIARNIDISDSSFEQKIQHLYETYIWPQMHLGDIYKHFVQIANGNSILNETIFSDETIRNIFKQEIISKLRTSKKKIRGIVTIECNNSMGIIAIKDIAQCAIAHAFSKNIELKIQYLSSPKYLLLAESFDFEHVIDIINEALEIAQAKANELNSEFNIIELPHVLNNSELQKLHQNMINYEEEMKDVPGDDA
jgi:translation initiation factor 2 subunit 1